MKVLVTGGAGYIGRVTCQRLHQNGWEPVVYDLKNGQDISDTARLTQTLKREKVAAVIHLAAFISMGESMARPKKYFDNNLIGSQSLLESMVAAGVDKLIFSSTAGVYGNPDRLPIRETDRKQPGNPYGLSKLLTEELIGFYGRIYGLKAICLRYFNAAGATLDGRLGEDHQPETHLIPNLIRAVLAERPFTLFGDDYPTKDGTCIRDYIHVLDLAQAHFLALKALQAGHQSAVYNAGAGRGYSNREVIKTAEKVSGKKVRVTIKPRRPGDAAELVADPSKFQAEFDWRPQYSDLNTIISTAWKHHS